MYQFPAPTGMQLPVTNLRYARSYVLDQPYTCTVTPDKALKHGTMFPFLLETYLPGLKAAEEGKMIWKT